MEKHTTILLSLLLLGCVADLVQCRRIDDIGVDEIRVNIPRGICYRSVWISNPCLIHDRCWCCYDNNSCYSTEDDCQRACPKI
ncbi:hypothetical protein BDA96_04G106800 [Sorghum bicolor]|uniref:Meg domain-containing protein n=2 Tax=Sorghum bicolor TaxID=4558 RepID=A0A921R1X4_SORBI|nr:hypothetical protein BDA96_04G106800 [Sorghum bicolor]OQU84668.1 hypothetical protein SORBI_3004G099050 [Sorghum bicolor]